jgi:hypothetical protein
LKQRVVGGATPPAARSRFAASASNRSFLAAAQSAHRDGTYQPASA